MRGIMKLISVIGMACLVTALAVPSAQANCNPGKFAGNGYTGWVVTGADEASIQGRFWQQGNRTLGNEGGNTTGWIYFFGPNVYMNKFLGDADVVGCPASRLLTTGFVRTLDGGAKFLAATIDETPAEAIGFNYEPLGALEFVEIPRIQVTSSSRGAGTVTLNFTVPAIGGTYGPGAATAIAAVNVLSAAGTTDPGRGAAAYTLLQSFPTTAGGPVSGSVTVDCSNTAVDRFVVTQIGFEQGVNSDLVGRAVRVECDPTLADPGREFKLIDGPKEKPRPARER